MNNVKAHIESLGGKFFTATFIKKDGSIRTMNCRTDVKKHLRGGRNPNQNPDHVFVYDLESGGYRTIDTTKVIEIHSQGFTFKI